MLGPEGGCGVDRSPCHGWSPRAWAAEDVLQTVGSTRHVNRCSGPVVARWRLLKGVGRLLPQVLKKEEPFNVLVGSS